MPATGKRNQSSTRFRPIHINGTANTSGTNPFASTAIPNKAAAIGRRSQSPVSSQRSDSSIAAENAAAMGRSVTATRLNASQAALVARIAVANHAVSPLNSRRKIQKKNTRYAMLNKATGTRGASSSPKPARKPTPVIQYSRAGFSNHGSPHNRGVAQSPD